MGVHNLCALFYNFFCDCCAGYGKILRVKKWAKIKGAYVLSRRNVARIIAAISAALLAFHTATAALSPQDEALRRLLAFFRQGNVSRNAAESLAVTMWYHVWPMPTMAKVSSSGRSRRSADSTPSSTTESDASRSTTSRTFGM